MYKRIRHELKSFLMIFQYQIIYLSNLIIMTPTLDLRFNLLNMINFTFNSDGFFHYTKKKSLIMIFFF